MNNNRLNIINKKRKRRNINNAILIIVMLVALGFGIYMITKALGNNKPSEQDEDTTTTTITTVETTTTTEAIAVPMVGNIYEKDFVYNFRLHNDYYIIIVCNRESNARVRNFKIYYSGNLIGESNSLVGLRVEKDQIDLNNRTPLIVEINNKKYGLKYSNTCNWG